MVLYAIADMASGFIDPTYWLDALQPTHWQLHVDLLALGDKMIQVDLAGDVQKAFNNFVKTGQVWAFLIGIIFGYFVKTFTSFG